MTCYASRFVSACSHLFLGLAVAILACQHTCSAAMNECFTTVDLQASACDSSDLPGCNLPDAGATNSLLERLQRCCQNQASRVALGGWISAGLTQNGDGNRSGNGNSPYGYNNVSDGVALNQLWCFAEREAAADGLDWGFRIDALFGTDGPDNQAFADQTWDFGWDSGRDYGAAIPQLYADLRYNDLLLRVGYFLTPIGWESVPAPLNFFYSHSFTFYYSEPNTHSGFLATYQVSDTLTLQGGWTMGMDSSFANELHASTFLGGATLVLTPQTTITWSLLAGDWGDGSGRDNVPSNEGNIYLHSLILEHQISDRCSYVLHNDLGINTNQVAAGDAHWYAIVQYLTYEINDQFQMGMRGEWFRDEEGVRLESDAGNTSNNFYDLTLGLNWKPGERWILRPEVRWDAAGGGNRVFDNGTEDDFFTYAIDAVATF